MTRIVGGALKGRRLTLPDDARVRPTADRVREAWISIVAPHLADARILDLFAGSGALGLEALSRGAREATFVELAPRSLGALRANIDALGVGDQATVRRGDALRWVARYAGPPFDVAFADPPYGTGQAVRTAEAFRRQPFARFLGIEHDPAEPVSGDDQRRWGGVAVTFLHAEDA